MGPFPLLIFMGLPYNRALTDRAQNTATVWETMEWPLIGLSIFFWRPVSLTFLIRFHH